MRRQILLCGILAFAVPTVVADDSVKQDFKTAGQGVKQGAKDVGHGIKRKAKKVGHGVKHSVTGN